MRFFYFEGLPEGAIEEEHPWNRNTATKVVGQISLSSVGKHVVAGGLYRFTASVVGANISLVSPKVTTNLTVRKLFNSFLPEFIFAKKLILLKLVI